MPTPNKGFSIGITFTISKPLKVVSVLHIESTRIISPFFIFIPKQLEDSANPPHGNDGKSI